MVLPLILGLGLPEILLIALLALLFFGGRKLPELMKGLGKGVKSFKDGMSGVDGTSGSETGTDAAAGKAKEETTPKEE